MLLGKRLMLSFIVYRILKDNTKMAEYVGIMIFLHEGTGKRTSNLSFHLHFTMSV